MPASLLPSRRQVLLTGAALVTAPALAASPVALSALDDFAIVRSSGRWWLVGELLAAHPGGSTIELRGLHALGPGAAATRLLTLTPAELQAAGALPRGKPLERAALGAGE